MRKRIVGIPVGVHAESDGGWLNLSEMATVEVQSEDAEFPIEAAFGRDGGKGWRASGTGPQLIRILFDEPARINRIHLSFHEPAVERTQEFSLSWCPAAGGCIEIVRQQWNFSPGGSTTEREEFAVNLDNVAVLELAIRPELNGQGGIATLASWRLS